MIYLILGFIVGFLMCLAGVPAWVVMILGLVLVLFGRSEREERPADARTKADWGRWKL